MNMPNTRTYRTVPDRVPINDPQLLAKLWEKEEIRATQDTLKIIFEHLDLANADLTIVAWEKFLSLFDKLDIRYDLNVENTRINAGHLGIEIAMEENGIDALTVVLESIDLSDTTRFFEAKVHPARHLVCNIGVLRACTVMKAARALMRSTYAIEPTSGLLELMSRLDQHQQILGAELLEYRDRTHTELVSQGFDVKLWGLMPEIDDLNRTGLAYWRISC